MWRHLRIFWHIAWQAVAYIFVPAIVALAIVFLIRLVSDTRIEDTQVGLIGDIGTIVILLFFFFKTRPSYLPDFFEKSLTIRRLALLVPISIIARLLLFAVMIVLITIGGEGLAKALSEGVELQWEGVTMDTLFKSIGTIVSFAILTPIHEELFFRGAVMGFLKKHYSPKIAILYSTYLFALLHGHPGLFPSTFILGFVLAIVYYRWKNIWYPIIMHMLINLHPFVIDWLLSQTAFHFW